MHVCSELKKKERRKKQRTHKILSYASNSTVILVAATISVLPRLHVTTVQSFGATSREMDHESSIRSASFVLLQLVNALKSLQARGIEDASRSLNDVVLCREDKDACYRLYLLQGFVFLTACTVTVMRQSNLIVRMHPHTSPANVLLPPLLLFFL